MSRGGHKCIVVIQHKNEEDAIVAPDFFKQSFADLEVQSGSQITLMEFKNYDLSDADEGGEDENEEMEEEQVEVEPEQVAAPEDDEEQDPKASEVLFDEGQKKEE